MADNVFHGDRPIQSADQDLFGFDPLAERIAQALTAQAATKGFVIGVEGLWGSGKSSVMALTLAHLKKMPADKVVAIEFKPWLIGDRDQLLVALFEDLVKAIAGLEHARGDATNSTVLAATEVANKVRRFASHLGPLGKLAGVTGLVIPGLTIAGGILTQISDAAKEQATEPTLAEQKEDLASSLIRLDCRIVVAIDDVDRLEPREVAELLRLVRSVADFPNVSYLLCYDGAALANAIEKATDIENGRAYLQKIVQTEIAVPRPESFALRRWFSSELARLVGCNQERAPYLTQVIDETGGRSFDTPRMVVRVLDSLRTYLPGLEGRVDLPDLVWLRIIAVASPNLYRWIEEYLTAYSALAAGRVHISDEQRADMARRLDVALAQDGITGKMFFYELDRHLPGISTLSFDKDPEKRLFSQHQRMSHFKDVQDARLASPSHSRLYFTLVEPPDSVGDMDIADVLHAARDGVNDAAMLILQMGGAIGDAGATKAEKLLDQLRHVDGDTLAGWPLENLLMAVSNAADELGRHESRDDWGYPRVWYLAKDLLKRIHSRIPDQRWAPVIRELFEQSVSLGFLSYLLRDETFGHGFYGNRPDPMERLTSREDFEQIREIMLARYNEEGLDKVLCHQNSTTMLYAWSQAGGRGELIKLIATRAVDDRWLLDFLKRISSTSSGTDGIHATLSFEAIGNFFEAPTDVGRRVLRLSRAAPAVPGAAETVQALEQSLRFDGRKLGDFLAHEAIAASAEDQHTEDASH